MPETSEHYSFDSTNLIIFLLKWRKPLFIICIVAAVTSAIVSFIIEPKYRSTVILFPATTQSVSKALLNENAFGKNDILKFGDEEETEQLLQILQSDEIRNAIADKYDLIKHYDIDTTGKFVQTRLINKYENNITFKRTEYNSVRIDVLDKSPDTAMLIANDIAALSDTVKNRIQHERSHKALRIVEGEYMEIRQYVNTLADSLTLLRRMGVQEYEVQIDRMTEQYARAIVEGKEKAVKILKMQMDTIAKYGSNYVELRNKMEDGIKRISLIRNKYEEAKVDAYQKLPHKFIVNSAFKSEKKAYPIRWLIVLLSTTAAFLLSILAIIGIENWKRFKLMKNAP